MVVYKEHMIEHAWNIPKDSVYEKLLWRNERLYALNTATGTVDVWSAEEQRYINKDMEGAGENHGITMFDVLGREQVLYDGRVLRKEVIYYDGEASRCIQGEVEMTNVRHLISTKEYIIVLNEVEDGKANVNVLDYSLGTMKRVEVGSGIRAVAAHKQFNWIAILYEHEIQIHQNTTSEGNRQNQLWEGIR